MRRASLTILCVCLLLVQMPVDADIGRSEVESGDDTGDVIERTVHAGGTQYDIQVNTSNHTVQVSAVHLADNETSAGYVVQVNDNRVIDVFWEASKGDQNHTEADLMYHYDAGKEVREITFSTYGGSANITYNFTTPRKHEGRYLRPTLTDVSFERINDSWGRVTFTVRSDAQYYYPAYVVVWTPELDAEWVYMDRQKGDNVTRKSLLVPVENGEPFEGEVRMHPRNISETGPLHSQYEFFGRPGNSSFEEVPYEPLRGNKFESHSYESQRVDEEQSKVSDEQFRVAIGGLAVVLVLVILGAVVVSSGRRRV